MTASDDETDHEKAEKHSRVSVPVIASLASMTNIERKLVKLFKCCFYRDRCFFTTDDAFSFLKHLKNHHGEKNFSCIYCYYQSGDDEFHDKADRLIDHILINHGLRNYQCNLCIYRGLSIPHVLLHQANIHGNKYQTTLSGDESVGTCKVLVCKQVVEGPLPGETVYWSNCRVDSIAATSDDPPKYQCLYCDFVSLVPHVVFFHICKVHPDYSLCLFDKYVDQLPEIKETEEDKAEDEEDAELDAIVHDLHSFGTKDDDDVDMSAFDDAPVEDLSDPEDASNPQNTTDEAKRERLFALKGVRIAKKQPEKSSKARKSTSKPVAQPEPEAELDFDKDDEEEDESSMSIRKRIMRGFRPEQSAALFKPMPLTGSKHNERNMFKCLLCADNSQISKIAIDSHLKKHNTTSSFKCNECSFLGSPNEITAHFKEEHKSSDAPVKYIKFIVPLDENEGANQLLNIRPVRVDERPAPKSKKKAQGSDPKNLSSKIKKSVFIGPKSWRDKQNQKRKQRSDENSAEEESDIEIDTGDNLETEVEISREEVNKHRDSRETRRIQRKKRKIAETDQEMDGPFEELLEPKKASDRESEHYFCLFCSAFKSVNFKEAQDHMKLHLSLNELTCPHCSYTCQTRQEQCDHFDEDHPFEQVPPYNENANNTHINYITEFLNEQFLHRRKGHQMTSDQANRYARVICPICERANKVTDDSNYHFTQWKSFKIHFWKHANATFIKCLKCLALVPRTKKRSHLYDRHFRDLEEDTWEIKDFGPHFEDPLTPITIRFLRNLKLKCKTDYENRVKEEFEIPECQVILDSSLRKACEDFTTGGVKVKEEPQDTSNM